MTTLLQSEIVSVYVVFGSEEEARRIGRDMVERRLAACVNILGPCHSIYRWQGRVEEAAEVPAIFKTSWEAHESLTAAIAAAHSYDQPAVTAWPNAATTPGYRQWVEEQTR